MDQPKDFDRVVVGVGPDDLARQAMAMGVAVAAPDDLPIDVVSVVAPGSDELPERRSVLAAALADSEGVDESSLEILRGWSVAQELADYADAHQPALLCLATAVRSRADDALLGSTVGGVLHRVTSPVLVTALDQPLDGLLTGPVVVCVDASEESESILPLADAWVKRSGQTPWIVTHAHADAPLDPALEQRGVHRLADTMSGDAEWQVLRGSSTGPDIAGFAAEMEAGLIVMATHGRSALGRVALGSTAMSIMGQSPCPVLLRRPSSVALDPPADDDGG